MRSSFFAFLLVCSLTLGTPPPPAAAQDVSGTDTFLRLSGITEAGPPNVMDDLVVFTFEQEEYARYVAVAFGHENYEQKHVFTARRREGQADLFYLAYPIAPEWEQLDYRFIVDGVWLTDPNAPTTHTDRRGITIGRVQLPEIPPYREQSPVIHGDGTVTFRFSVDIRISPTLETVDRRQVSVSELDQPNISLMGSFNGWDPFMYRLRPDPDREGFFSVRVPLSPGRHHYYFLLDGERVLDPFNRERARDRSTGGLVSTIVVPR